MKTYGTLSAEREVLGACDVDQNVDERKPFKSLSIVPQINKVISS